MALWLASQPLVLASRSDVRSKILAAAGLRFEVRASTIDERAIEAQARIDDPVGVARHLAHAKASAVAGGLPGRVILAADQTRDVRNFGLLFVAQHGETVRRLQRLGG